MQHQEILSVRKLTKTYNQNPNPITALNNVSFDLKKGEIVTIMGASGSGKSTLLNVLGALDAPDKGEIHVNGTEIKNVFQEPQATAYRSQYIGFVFQSFHLMKDLTVEENVRLPLILKGISGQIGEEKTDEILEHISMYSLRHQYPDQLSGGQQQRVAIARSLIMSPPILLADEPTGNLDYQTTQDVMNVLLRMREIYNQTILVVTHDPVVSTYADRVIFFKDGKIAGEHVCKSNENHIAHILKFYQQTMIEGGS